MNFLENLFKKENLLARLISLLVACGLWVYVMTDQNPIVERSYDINLERSGLAESMVVFNAPEKVSVRVRAARTILNDEAVKNITASIDLHNATEGQKDLPVTARFANGEVVSVSPKDVSVYVDTISEKRVPVVTRVVGNSDDDLTIGNNGITPSEVMVKGATHRLENINSIVAPIDISNQRENFQTESTLVAVNAEGYGVPNVTIIPDKVSVNAVIVRKMITVDLPIVVNMTGELPEGVRVNQTEVVPKSVRVTAPPSVLKHLREIVTRPVDVSALNGSTSMAVELDLPDKIIPEVRSVEVRFSVERQ